MSLVSDAGGSRKSDRLITVREACSIVGLSRSTLYERIRSGVCPAPVKLGKLTRFSECEVQAYVASVLAARAA